MGGERNKIGRKRKGKGKRKGDLFLKTSLLTIFAVAV